MLRNMLDYMYSNCNMNHILSQQHSCCIQAINRPKEMRGINDPILLISLPQFISCQSR